MHPAVFLIGCLGTRLGLALLARHLAVKSPTRLLPLLGALLCLPAAGMLLIFFNDWRKTGPETSGRPIWWNKLRPVHAFMYILFAYATAFSCTRSSAWRILLLDVLLGGAAYLVFMARKKNDPY